MSITPRNGTEKARQLRRRGYIPAIFYGYNQKSTPVLFNQIEISRLIRKMGENALFEIALETEIKPVRIKEVQRDPVSKEIIHIDIQNIHMDRKIHATVPLKFSGINEIQRRGFIFQYQINKIQIVGLGRDIPSYIKVPVGSLAPGETIHIHDLEIADELTIIEQEYDVIGSVLKSNSDDIKDVNAQEDTDHNEDEETIDSEETEVIQN